MIRRIQVKRLIAFLILCMMLFTEAAAEENTGETVELTFQYEAYVVSETFMRKGIDNRESLDFLKENLRVRVTEYGEKWCQIYYRSMVGYVRTNCLARFRSLDPEKYPVPGHTQTIGVVTLAAPTQVIGGRFKGVTAHEGAVLCVTQADDAQYTLPVWRGTGTLQADTGAFLPFTPWQDAQPGDLIAGFTTYYNRSTGGSLAKGRMYNIELCCQRLDGCLLQPGEQFSFNATTGPYNKAHGYHVGPAINESNSNYGGGVCQVSTTLYNALLTVPVQVDNWAVHRRSGVTYVPQWFDAAVSAYSNLKFTNTLPYPIRIWANPQDGVLSVLLYRAEE